MLLARGVGLSATTDSELITQILAAPPDSWNGANGNGTHDPDRWIARIRAFMHLADGAYSLVLLTSRRDLRRARSVGAAPVVPGQTRRGLCGRFGNLRPQYHRRGLRAPHRTGRDRPAGP